jgi:hypothetical protein
MNDAQVPAVQELVGVCILLPYLVHGGTSPPPHPLWHDAAYGPPACGHGGPGPDASGQHLRRPCGLGRCEQLLVVEVLAAAGAGASPSPCCWPALSASLLPLAGSGAMYTMACYMAQLVPLEDVLYRCTPSSWYGYWPVVTHRHNLDSNTDPRVLLRVLPAPDAFRSQSGC